MPAKMIERKINEDSPVNSSQLYLTVSSYFDAWNRGDANTVCNYFAEDGVYIDTALNKEYRGAEIQQYVEKVLSEPDGELIFSIIEQPVINDDVVFLRSKVKIINDNSTSQFESAELIKFKRDKIVLLQTYYDYSAEKEALSVPDEKYAKLGLNEKKVEEIKVRLERLMTEKEPFKNSSLSLEELSELLEIKRNQLSLIINLEYQMKFFDFINKYRLDAFMAELNKHSSHDVNITALAYDVGFSSSSVFYKIFKKYQDISPGQYLKNICKT